MEFFENYARKECVLRGEEIKKIADFCRESDCVMIVSKGGLMVINTYKEKAVYTSKIQTTVKKFIAVQSHFLNSYSIDLSEINDRDLYVLVFDKDEGHVVLETLDGKALAYISAKIYIPPC